jgi:ubiquinone/menaquinone biosynthesis C-methylase UbiE
MQVSDFWDGQAATFDDEPDHGLREPAVRAAWARTLLPLMPGPPAAVADLGAGTGSLAVLLALAGYRVSGLDIAPAMVAVAQAKAEAAGVAASFEVGDAAEPPWKPGTFEVVLCRHVLWALPDPHAAVGAWLRLLAPGGRLLLVEGRWHTEQGLTREQVLALLSGHGRGATVTSLDDPDLWGGPISDDRYLVLATA